MLKELVNLSHKYFINIKLPIFIKYIHNICKDIAEIFLMKFQYCKKYVLLIANESNLMWKEFINLHKYFIIIKLPIFLKYIHNISKDIAM